MNRVEHTSPEGEPIRTLERRVCPLCGRAGSPRYGEMTDRIGDAPGRWQLRECRACDLFWLDPQPLPEDLHLLYRDYYTHAEAEPRRAATFRERVRAAILAASFGYEPAGAVSPGRVAGALATLKRVRESVAIDVLGLAAGERGRLLEIGCGSGAFLERMRQLGWEVAGFEPDPVAAEIARTRRGLDVRAGTLEAAGFAEGTFDAVALHHVIEHLPDPPGNAALRAHAAPARRRPGDRHPQHAQSRAARVRRELAALGPAPPPPHLLRLLAGRPRAAREFPGRGRHDPDARRALGVRREMANRAGGTLSGSLGREAAALGEARRPALPAPGGFSPCPGSIGRGAAADRAA